MSAIVTVVTLLAVPLALGTLVLAWCGVPLDLKRPSWLAFAAALGLGMAGAAAFLSLLVAQRILIGIELVLLVGLLALVRKRPLLSSTCAPDKSALAALSLGIVVVVSALAALAFVSWSFRRPNGAWDAWAFWNTKARVLALGGESWTWIFSQLVDWWHPEYPILHPLTVARGWVLVGSESALVPAIIATVFTLGCVVLLAFGLSTLRDRSAALLGALVLVGTPNFVLHGASQYADIPLAFFMLLTVVALAWADAEPDRERASRLFCLSGLAAGLGWFTKNEGTMFCVSLVVARSFITLRAGGWAAWKREASAFARGAAAPLALVAVLQLGYATRPLNSEFFPAQLGLGKMIAHVGAQLSNPTRWSGFFQAWWFHLRTFDAARVPVLALLFGYALVAGRDPSRRRTTTATLGLALLLDALGTSSVFLAWSTLKIHEHMDALNRLLLQILPTLAFAILLTVPGPLSRARASAKLVR